MPTDAPRLVDEPRALQLAAALRAAPPRDAQVLLHAAADRAGLAAFYGIDAGPAERLVSEALDGITPFLARGVTSASFVGHLAAHLPGVKAQLADLEAAWERSPAAARETLLRRLAIVAIVAATAWFYAHRP